MLHNAGRVPVPHEMVRKIQELISSGKLKEGDKLPSQRVLSGLLPVSWTPR